MVLRFTTKLISVFRENDGKIRIELDTLDLVLNWRIVNRLTMIGDTVI